MGQERVTRFIKVLFVSTFIMFFTGCGESYNKGKESVESKVSNKVAVQTTYEAEAASTEKIKSSSERLGDSAGMQTLFKLDSSVTFKVNVESAGVYDLTFRVRSDSVANRFNNQYKIFIDGSEINGFSGELSTIKQDTSGSLGSDWYWGDYKGLDMVLSQGVHRIKIVPKRAWSGIDYLSIEGETSSDGTVDITRPVILLNGESNVVLNVGESYLDAGATAHDNIDGDLSSSIITINLVDTSTAGTYMVRYNVKDRANNEALEVIRRVKVNEIDSSNIATNYEDAENQKTNKWSILSNHSHVANIENSYDDETNSRVIYLDAKIKEGNKKSHDIFKFDGIDSHKDNRFIQWSMKFNQIFTIRVNITTSKGRRWIEYIAKDTGSGKYNEKIVHGIGSDKTNNNWHTITRDLERDLKRYEADNNFIQINYITIQGGGYIDNIKSYKAEDNLEINKPVIVSKPGIVLTFDDSYVENWNDMQSIFREKGAVATFFCNRWASNQNWNLPDLDISILKSFQEYGHEIAYHTSDHVSTQDSRYNNVPNKAQAYLESQIIPGLVYMKNKGFEPTSFSYPYISGQPEHNRLIRQELPHIREFFAHVTLTDDPGNKSLDEIRHHLEQLKRDKDIGVFLSHWIHYKGENDAESATERHKYKISKEKLIKIMDMVNEMGLEFYTLEEAHNIYMN